MKKKTRIPSAIPIYVAAGIWLLYGMVLPLYQAEHLLMAAGLSVVAFLAAGKFFPGRAVDEAHDLTSVTNDKTK